MVCGHLSGAFGAFYSEDYIRELRTTAHVMIAMVDQLLSRTHPAGMANAVMFDPVFMSEIRDLRNINNLLRLLTR
jgi:hypothetical protein